jgi:CSLREA domain-containing protein
VKTSRALLAVLTLLTVVAFAPPARGAGSLIVNSPDDPGDGTCDAAECTLREAIEAANANAPIGDSISFDFPGSDVHTITPSSPLPTINVPLVLDGYEQAGSSQNTLATGNDAVLAVELNGHNAGDDADALVLGQGSDGSLVRGLVIRDWDGNAIELDGVPGGIFGAAIQGNFIGTDFSGTRAAPNLRGVLVMGGGQVEVGGDDAAEHNVIAANVNEGVVFDACTNCLVQNNSIGTKKDGVSRLGNGGSGVFVNGSGNEIVDNVIAFNAKASNAETRGGVWVSTGTGNQILRNSIHSNKGRGISLGGARNVNDALDADTGPNLEQNFPVIKKAVDTGPQAALRISLKSTPTTVFDIHLYWNPPSPHDEGKTFSFAFGPVQTDASGFVKFTGSAPPIPAGSYVTATATDPDGNTSEFSVPVEVLPL